MLASSRPQSRFESRVWAETAVAVSLLVGLGCASPQPDAPPPDVGLVLLVAVDQLRPERLSAELPGGLGRLVREGRVFADAALTHAGTFTCPGHVAMATGRHPGPIGVPGNAYIARGSTQSVYCVEDASADAAPLEGEAGSAGRSPRAIGATALGDWMKASRDETRVYSVAGKDRAAVAMGGQRADGAWWFDRKLAIGFTSSRYYFEGPHRETTAQVPIWAASFKGEEFLRDLPVEWEHPVDAPDARPDDDPAESPVFSRTSPHPVVGADESSPRAVGERAYASPFVDLQTLAFARALVEAEDLGASAHGPDLLALSLSGTDLVGHLYGPRSQEARDALLRIDAAFAEFLSMLEARVGRGRVLVALSADHGVLPLPERFQEQGLSRCSVEGGRISGREMIATINDAVAARFGPPGGADGRQWVLLSETRLVVDRSLAAERGVELPALLETVREAALSIPGVEHVWTTDELEAGRVPEPHAALQRASYHPGRSGDLVFQGEYGCLLSGRPHGTSHGSPHDYDRRVPIVFWGSGVEPGVVRGPAAAIDIAPTLADQLGLPPGALPGVLDGHPLPLRGPSVR